MSCACTCLCDTLHVFASKRDVALSKKISYNVGEGGVDVQPGTAVSKVAISQISPQKSFR